MENDQKIKGVDGYRVCRERMREFRERKSKG